MRLARDWRDHLRSGSQAALGAATQSWAHAQATLTTACAAKAWNWASTASPTLAAKLMARPDQAMEVQGMEVVLGCARMAAGRPCGCPKAPPPPPSPPPHERSAAERCVPTFACCWSIRQGAVLLACLCMRVSRVLREWRGQAQWPCQLAAPCLACPLASTRRTQLQPCSQPCTLPSLLCSRAENELAAHKLGGRAWPGPAAVRGQGDVGRE